MRIGFLTFIVLAVVSCGGTVPEEPPPDRATEAGSYWPTAGWRTATPEAQGLDGDVLAAFDLELGEQHGYVDGMLVVRHGFLVFERSYVHDYEALFEKAADRTPGQYNYYDPAWHPYYRRGRLHTMQSVSKSVTSALVGIAIARGEIPGVDVRMLPYFGDFTVTHPGPRWEQMTLAHVLTMSTGIAWDESTVPYTDPANSCAAMERSEDWIQFVLSQPMAQDPGTAFVYNSGATQLLSHLLETTTGRGVHEYAAERLFEPLGIAEHYWKRTPKGLADTEGGLYLTARDLAKFGYLYLRDGVWDGRRLLPEGWVAASTQPLFDTGRGGERARQYGYKWWLLPHGDPSQPEYAWAALGYGGQLLIVVPEQDLIGVFTGWNIYDKPSLSPQLALDRLLAAVATSS